MHSPQYSALTRVEVLAAMAILGVLVVLMIPALRHGTCERSTLSSLSNLKQLQMATAAMVMDGQAGNDPARGWPGDTGGTFSSWARQLVPDYLTTNDFAKLNSAPGVAGRPGELPMRAQSAVRVYAVRAVSASNTVFLSTANFTNTPTGGTRPGVQARPFGDKMFAVLRKDGSGAMLQGRQAGQTNVIGASAPVCR